jgi:hypothetical protein
LKITKKMGLLCVFLISLSMMSGAFATDNSYPSEKQINTKVGQEFTIIEGKGFWYNHWSYNYVPVYDPHYLSLVSVKHMPPLNDIVGSCGTDIFVFKAIKAGDTHINLLGNQYVDPYSIYDGPSYSVHITE